LLLPAASPPPGATITGEVVFDMGDVPLGAYSVAVQCDPNVLEIAEVRGGATEEFGGLPAHRIDGCEARVAGLQAGRDDGPTGRVSVARVTLRVKTCLPGVETQVQLIVRTLFDTQVNPLEAQGSRAVVTVGPECGGDEECSDEDACTGLEACVAGCCAPGVPVVCAPADACHVAGVCDPLTGECSSQAVPDGTVCEDGDVCTEGEACQEGDCTGGAAKSCDDGNACTMDRCSPQVTGDHCERRQVTLEDARGPITSPVVIDECVGEVVPRAVETLRGRAERLLEKAAEAKPMKAKRLVRKVLSKLRAALMKLKRKCNNGKLPEPCCTALRERLDEATALSDCVLGQLKQATR
jgi:hypothetical protein